MRVNSLSQGIGGSMVLKSDVIESVKKSLESIAKEHKLSVGDLLSEAEDAGSDAKPYQVRALRLKERLDKLTE